MSCEDINGGAVGVITNDAADYKLINAPSETGKIIMVGSRSSAVEASRCAERLGFELMLISDASDACQLLAHVETVCLLTHSG